MHWRLSSADEITRCHILAQTIIETSKEAVLRRLQESLINYSNRPIAKRDGVRCSASVRPHSSTDVEVDHAPEQRAYRGNDETRLIDPTTGRKDHLQDTDDHSRVAAQHPHESREAPVYRKVA